MVIIIALCPFYQITKIETFFKNIGTANPLINIGHAVLVVYTCSNLFFYV